MELTKEEQNAINTLKRLEKRWPKGLWLFSNGMSISIMKYPENMDDIVNESGGMNQDYIVDSIDIPNDGGDW
jgi:hypothetical protein